MGVLESQLLPWAANTLQIPLVLCYGTPKSTQPPPPLQERVETWGFSGWTLYEVPT